MFNPVTVKMFSDKVLAVLVCFTCYAVCMEEHVFMEHAKMEDQASSATGYAYSSDSDHPMSYTHYSDITSDMEHVENPYAQEILPPYEYHYIPVVDSSMHYVPEKYLDSHYSSYGYPSAYSEIDYNRIKYGFGKHFGDNFEESHDSKYGSEDHSSQGNKGGSGYNKLFGWDTGKKGEYEKGDHKGWYGEKGGKKQGHHELGEKWSAKEAAGKANKGESFKEAKGHKKGEKTSGYHKVYAKDEFTKDHDFYDKADHKGHFDKYGSFDAKHEDKESDFKKGGKHQSGYEADEQGKKGYYDKGAHDEHELSYEGDHAENDFHKNYEEFVKKAGEHDDKHYDYDSHKGGKWKF